MRQMLMIKDKLARRLLWLGLLVILSTALAGCAPASSSAPASTKSATTESSAPTAPASNIGGTGIPSTGGGTVSVVQDAGLGDLLVDHAGLTLYKWATDSVGKSNCDASCLAIWPPLLAKGPIKPAASLNADDFGTTQTTDGRTMITYKGSPLYYYAGDKNPGETNGNGLNIGGIWTVVAP